MPTEVRGDHEEDSEEDVEMLEEASPKKCNLNLPLPAHLNHMMKLFEQFDVNFRLSRQRHESWSITLETLSAMIESSYNRNFKESHFRQFLTIVPGFYLHKWEMRKGRLQLMVDIPADLNEQMENPKISLLPR